MQLICNNNPKWNFPDEFQMKKMQYLKSYELSHCPLQSMNTYLLKFFCGKHLLLFSITFDTI